MLPVLTAAEARELDQQAIERGVESFELMRRAGLRLAHLLLSRDPGLPGKRVQVLVGPGNNGGDGWVVARALSEAGCQVAVDGIAPRSPEAIAARALLQNELPQCIENPHIVIDAVLGTGARRPIRDEIGALLASPTASRAYRVAVDMPSGLDATTGQAAPEVQGADLTVTFGTWKRGQLARRDLTGELVCLDIGLGTPRETVPLALDAGDVARMVPKIGALATKSERGRLAVVGGAPGMAGSNILAARGAFASGIGMVRCLVHPASVVSINAACPQATAISWDAPDLASGLSWSHAAVVGPGFGLEDGRRRLDPWLSSLRVPLVLDADALTAYAGEAEGLGRAIAGRACVLTPHATEAARLLGVDPDQVREDPYAAASVLSAATGATVLLKGVPTVVAAEGRCRVIPRGTPLLGTGGSGDLLAGITGALLIQTGDPMAAACVAAFVHGHAAELADPDRRVRGLTLEHVLEALPRAWKLTSSAPEFESLSGWLPRVA